MVPWERDGLRVACGVWSWRGQPSQRLGRRALPGRWAWQRASTRALTPAHHLAEQVGACIVDQRDVICGIGYNGFPRGCSDSKLPWAKSSEDGDPLQTKYPYVCHAEMNAILNKNGASVAGAVRCVIARA